MDKTNSSAAKELIQHIEHIAAKMEEIASLCPHVNGAGSAKQLQALAKRLETLPESELADAYAALQEVPHWHQIPDQMSDIVDKVKKAVEPKQAEQLLVATVPVNCSLGNCPSGPSQVQVDDLLIGVAAAELATAIAQATADTLAIFVITQLASKIAQAIASGLDVVAKGLALGAAIQQRAADVVEECEEDAVRQLLLGMCNAINDINKKVDEIGKDVKIVLEKLDILIKIVNEIKDVVDEILLHQIEEALAECKLLVGLYLPEQVSGSIDKVQEIVQKLIQNFKTAGLTTANAESYWKQGTAALAQGQYEKALRWFMLAYRQLQDKNMCKVPCPSNPCDKK